MVLSKTVTGVAVLTHSFQNNMKMPIMEKIYSVKWKNKCIRKRNKDGAEYWSTGKGLNGVQKRRKMNLKVHTILIFPENSLVPNIFILSIQWWRHSGNSGKIVYFSHCTKLILLITFYRIYFIKTLMPKRKILFSS